MTPRPPQHPSTTSKAPRLVLVLGGGGVRGCAHLGVLKAIEHLGLPVAEVIGTGLGAVVGAAWAAGLDAAAAADLITNLVSDPVAWPIAAEVDVGTAQAATARVHERIAQALPAGGFDALPRPLSCTALGLCTGAMRTFGLAGEPRVALADAVTASCVVPALHAPLPLDGELWMGAGWVDPLPLEVAGARRPELIVAVDLADHGHDRGVAGATPLGVLKRMLQCATGVAGAQRLHEVHARPDLVLVRPHIGDVPPWGPAEPHELAARGEWDAMLALANDPRTRWLCDAEVVKALDRAADAPADYVRLDVDSSACIHCGICAAVCPTGGYAAVPHGDVVRKIHHYECMRDASCVRACPTGAVRIGT